MGATEHLKTPHLTHPFNPDHQKYVQIQQHGETLTWIWSDVSGHQNNIYPTFTLSLALFCSVPSGKHITF